MLFRSMQAGALLFVLAAAGLLPARAADVGAPCAPADAFLRLSAPSGFGSPCPQVAPGTLQLESSYFQAGTPAAGAPAFPLVRPIDGTADLGRMPLGIDLVAGSSLDFDAATPIVDLGSGSGFAPDGDASAFARRLAALRVGVQPLSLASAAVRALPLNVAPALPGADPAVTGVTPSSFGFGFGFGATFAPPADSQAYLASGLDFHF